MGERKLIYIQKLIKFIAENMRKRENDIEKKGFGDGRRGDKATENIKEGLAFREVGEIGEKCLRVRLKRWWNLFMKCRRSIRKNRLKEC